MHAKDQDGSRSKILRLKQMFRAHFVSSFRDFTRHFNFWYFARATYNRNLDSLSLSVHSSYVVCRLRARAAKNPFEPQATFTRQTNVGQLESANSKLVCVNDKATRWQTVGDK